MPLARTAGVPGLQPGQERQSHQTRSPSASTTQGYGLGFSPDTLSTHTHIRGTTSLAQRAHGSGRKSGRSPTPVVTRNTESDDRTLVHRGVEIPAASALVSNGERRPRSRASSLNGARSKEKSEERKQKQQSSRYLSRRSQSPLVQPLPHASKYGWEYDKQEVDEVVVSSRRRDRSRKRSKDRITDDEDYQSPLVVSPSSPELAVGIVNSADQRLKRHHGVHDGHIKKQDTHSQKSNKETSKPRSILKSTSLKPRQRDESPEQTPVQLFNDTFNSGTRTPKLRSYFRSNTSPLPSASLSPVTGSRIPSPNLRARSPSSVSKPSRSPSHKSSSHHHQPNSDNIERISTKTSRGKASPNSFLRLSPSPAVSALPQFRDEGARISPNYRAVGLGISDKIGAPLNSPNLQDKHDRHRYQRSHLENDRSRRLLREEPPSLTFSNSEQSATESSEQETMLRENILDRPHERRKKEHINIVASHDIDSGFQDQSSTSAFSFVKELACVNKDLQLRHQRHSREESEEQGLSTSQSEQSHSSSSPKLEETHSEHLGNHVQNRWPREESPVQLPLFKRHSSSNPTKESAGKESQKTNVSLKPAVDNTNRDSLLMLNPERQREAFGIPPSQSNTQDEQDGFTSAESCVSIKPFALECNRDADTNYGSGFSHGAEKLFDTLGIGAQARRLSGRSQSVRRSSWRSSINHDMDRLPANQLTLSAASSTSSIYEDDVPNRPWQRREQDLERIQGPGGGSVKSTWKKTLSQSAYASLLDRHGELEMRRQEIIWELCETELAFLKNMRTALGIYVHPLLSKNRTWVSGLPSHISRLFDWLDDIYQLHGQISSALQHARSSQYPVVLHMAETLRFYVPKLEVYQPYIVRLDEVVEAVETMIKDPTNELGEFFRMQSVNEEHDGMVFSSFLWLPLTRLGRYLKYFNDLWEATPNTHVDYLPTFSLLHSATLVVRVMREVKLREEEYTFVKDLMSRIRGLPSDLQLVRRERRLIAHGLLHRFNGDLKQRNEIDKEQHAQDHRQFENHDRQRGIERTRLPVSYRRRANSLDSCLTSDLSDAASMLSFPSAGSDLSLAGVENTGRNTKRNTSDPKSVHFKDTDDSKRMPVGHSTKHKPLHEKMRITEIYAFIFTDLVVFTVPLGSNPNGTWELMDTIGACRVLSVTDETQSNVHGYMMGLQVLPLDIQHIEAGVSDTVATSLYIQVPDTLDTHTENKNARKRWWEAFQQCYLFTLRSLSLPTHSGRYLANGPNSSTGKDAGDRQSIMSILTSGQPLAKSPSVLILNAGTEDDTSSAERQERTWWAHRFQDVLRDVQHSDSFTPILQKMNAGQACQPHRKTINGKRRLKLGSNNGQ